MPTLGTGPWFTGSLEEVSPFGKTRSRSQPVSSSEVAAAEGVGVGSGVGSAGGAGASDPVFSQEIAQRALPPADLNATRPAPLSEGSLAVTQITILVPALNRPRAGCTARPPEVVADHETVASRAVSRICPAPSPMFDGHDTVSRPAGGGGVARVVPVARGGSVLGPRVGVGLATGRSFLGLFRGVGVGSVSGSSGGGSDVGSGAGSSVISEGSASGAAPKATSCPLTAITAPVAASTHTAASSSTGPPRPRRLRRRTGGIRVVRVPSSAGGVECRASASAGGRTPPGASSADGGITYRAAAPACRCGAPFCMSYSPISG